MNSLRRMLAEVPQLESKLALWTGGKLPAAKKSSRLDTSSTHQPSSPGHGTLNARDGQLAFLQSLQL